MSKLTRKDQKIFGETAGGESISVFGSLAANNPAYSTDPDQIQSAEYSGGWESAVIGQASPAMEDRNALDYLYSRQLGYLYQQGIAEYSATQTYYKGSIVSSFDADAGNLLLYYSLIDDNTGNALDDDTKWAEFKSGGGGGADLPILTFQFTDHELNSVSWAKSNFSWMDGTVYLAAYKHLRNDLGFRYASSTLTVSHSDYAAGTYVRISTLDTQISSTDYYAWGISGTTDPKKCIFTLTTTLADGVKVFAYKDASTIYQLTSGIVESQTETVGGTTITYYRAQDGHKIVLADQATNVASIYSATGIAWYFIFDDTNTQFKLPRSNWNFKATSNDDAGDFVDQSLPNITGSIGLIGPASGALYPSSASGTNYTLNTQTTGPAVDFNASKSSSVYQDGANVQEKATKAYLYFFVGNFEQTAIEQTAGLAQEDFLQKADTDLGNIDSDGKAAIANYAYPSNSFISLTWGSSGDEFTAVADGWVTATRTTNAANQYLMLSLYTPGGTWLMQAFQNTASAGSIISLNLPVSKGQKFKVTWSAPTGNGFQFIYAKGCEPQS